MCDSIEDARRRFAEELRYTARLGSQAVIAAFATVPRERFHTESRFLNFNDPAQSWSYGPVMRNPSLNNFSPRAASRCHRSNGARPGM